MSLIAIQAPDGLTEREIAAFRLGALRVLLAAKVRFDDVTTRTQFAAEIEQHERLLGATTEVEL